MTNSVVYVTHHEREPRISIAKWQEKNENSAPVLAVSHADVSASPEIKDRRAVTGQTATCFAGQDVIMMSNYYENRASIAPEELRRYEGKWAAFSPDGSRLIAAAGTLETLAQCLLKDGEDPQSVCFERIRLTDDEYQGALDFE